MKKKKTMLLLTFVFIVLGITGYIFLVPPKHTADDDNLFKWVSAEKDIIYYKNNSAIIPTSEETERAHDNFMRVRFNNIAASVLDTTGKLRNGASFPDSSIIVKEIFSEKNGLVEVLAVMVKLKGAPNSNKDWLWAEYSPSGGVEYSVNKNGKVCVSCHKSGDDYVRLFDIVK